MVWSLQAPIELSENQFVQWSKLVEERTGIQLSVRQKTLLQTQVTLRMRELGCADYNDYFAQVTQGLSGMREWSKLVDRLTVRETSFFRHRPSLEYVRRFLQNRINKNSVGQSFDIWSLGCASGEEAYSLAMVANDCFELAMLPPYYGITAMDISQSALELARAACYTKSRLGTLRTEEVQRYLVELDQGRFQVIGKLRDRVCFCSVNVVQTNSLPKLAVDVIFCQNLLVYFRRWLRRDILNSLADRLKPGGVLIVGAGEVADWEHPRLSRALGTEVQAYIRDERQTQ